MRNIRVLGATAVLAATALVAPGAASATQPTTVTGEFAGKIVYDHCTQGTAPHPGITSGTWSMTLNGSTAKGDFTILIDGVPHLSYKYPGMKEAPNSTTSDFVAYGKTTAGLLTVTVHGDTMAYTIAPYSYGGLVCDSVTYPGTVD